MLRFLKYLLSYIFLSGTIIEMAKEIGSETMIGVIGAILLILVIKTISGQPPASGSKDT